MFIHQEGFFTQCAVKSLHNDAGLKDRIEFLREASTMEGCRWPEMLSRLLVVSSSQNRTCGEAGRNGDQVSTCPCSDGIHGKW